MLAPGREIWYCFCRQKIEEVLCLPRTFQRPSLRVFCFCLALAAATLFFCSKSSPAYPINDWSDANVYLSAGKGMLEGRVMYRDLYDHKGPLIYALHALCAFFQPADFTGVWALEILLAAWFLYAAYRMVALKAGRRAALLALPLTALFVYASYCFQAGDSAEEFALPLTLTLTYHLELSFPEKAPASGKRLALDGFLFGCVFWMKFTLCGAPGGALLLLCVLETRKSGAKGFFRCLAFLLLGFGLSTLPWLLYFGLNGAVGDWLRVYLYDNLFPYSGGEGGLLWRVKQMAKSALEWLTKSPLCALPSLLGVAALSLRGGSPLCRLKTLLPFLLGALGVLIPGKTYPYYPLALGAFAPYFWLWLGPLCRERLDACATKAFALLTAAAFLFGAGLCPLVSGNVRESFGLRREETMQYQFAARMEETPGATLLNYGFLDAGFYTAAQVAPSVKYYHQANVPLPEMLEEQERYVREGVCDYVVTRGKQPADILDTYELVATADSPEGFWYEHVYLYQRKAQ